ncbi:hypothetical protein [Teichococcus aestuarii]|uniref:hypothetical protein n=1 Tax=Teichococcus aestuarii TaxID=568898 RepID=UPI00361B8417
MTDTTAVLGYARPLVVSPGEEVAFHLSSVTLEGAEATLLRVRCADPDPDGPGLRFHQPGTPLDGPVALRHQPLRPGSCALVPDAPALNRPGALSVAAFIHPTAPGTGPQTLLSRWRDDTAEGWRLGLDAEARLEFTLGAGGGSGASPRRARCWSGSGFLSVLATTRRRGGSPSSSPASTPRPGATWAAWPAPRPPERLHGRRTSPSSSPPMRWRPAPRPAPPGISTARSTARACSPPPATRPRCAPWPRA